MRRLILLLLIFIIPTTAFAQATVAGVVKDTFGAAWQQPNAIMPARFAKFTLQFDF